MTDVSGKFFSAKKVRTGVSPSSPGVQVGETLPPVNPPGTSLNSVGLTMPSAFAVANSPLTSNGTIAVTGAGTVAQYVRGDGTLASFPSLTGYVPYTGATQNVDLGEFGLDTGFVNLDTTPTNTPTTQGTMYWDDSRSTAALIMNGTLQHIGQDTFFYVKNASGSSIAKGTAVRFDGTDGASGHIKIAPFLANGTYPSNYFMGVAAETIANGGFGQVMHFGELDGINTSGFTAGALLYASTTTAGAFQTTAPVAPNNIVLIAAAINSKNNGAIIVRPTYGSNINQDEGVKIVSPTTGQLLQLQSNGLWENKTKAQVLGGTSSQFVKGDGSLDSTAYGTGTVTSVAALTLGTSGTDLSSTVANGTTTPVITLNVPTASATNRGALSSADWSMFNNKENAITAGTTAQYFRGDKTFQTLNTSVVPEGTNLYYTDGRARGALSFAAGSGAYNSSTGVITIPTNNNQIINGAGYITSSALAGYLPLTGGTLTGPLGGTSISLSGNLQLGTLTGGDSTATPNNINLNSTFSNTAGSNLKLILFNNTASDIYGIGVSNLQMDFSVPSGARYRFFNGTFTINNLAGSGTRMVVADSNGLLSTQSIPLGTVTSVTASSPLASSGGTTPNITIQQASGSQNGFLSSTDWTTFNNKQNALTNPVTGTGSAGQVAYWSSGSAITGESNLFWDSTNDRLGIGFSNPSQPLEVSKSQNADSVIQVTNTNSGNAATAQFWASNGTTTTQLFHTGTGYNTFGVLEANQGGLINTTSAGIALVAAGASGILRFATGGLTTRLSISSSGAAYFTNSVSIGTNSSSVSLEVLNTSAVVSNNPGNSQIRASASSTKWLSVGYDPTVNSGYLQGAESGISYRPIILNLLGTTTSPVLIGQSTSDGVSKLQVTGAATFSSSVTATQMAVGTNTLNRVLNISGTGTDGTQVQISGTVDSAGIKLIPVTGDNWEIQANTSNQFFVYNRTDSAYRFLIDGTGNVLIGTTTSVNNPLVVKSNTDGNSICLVGRSSDNASSLDFVGSNSSTFIATISADSLSMDIGSQIDIPLRFYTNTGEKMRIFSNGNVFIGSSPSDNGAKLSIAGGRTFINTGQTTASTAAYTAFNNLTFNDDFSNAANGPNKIITYGRGSTWVAGIGIHDNTQAYYAGGTHKFYRYDGTTATLNLALESNGNLLIGTGTDSGDKLRVAGTTFSNEIMTLLPEAESRSGINWRFGAASIASITPNRRLRVKVGGIEYYIGAVEV